MKLVNLENITTFRFKSDDAQTHEAFSIHVVLQTTPDELRAIANHLEDVAASHKHTFRESVSDDVSFEVSAGATRPKN